MLCLIIFLNPSFAGYIYHSKTLKKQSSGRQDDLVKYENTFSPYVGGREKLGSSLHHIQVHQVRQSPHSLKTFGPCACIGYWNCIILKQWVTLNCLRISKVFTCFNTTCCCCSQRGFFTFKTCSRTKLQQAITDSKVNDEEARHSLLRHSKICCCCWLCSCFCFSRCQRLSATP